MGKPVAKKKKSFNNGDTNSKHSRSRSSSDHNSPKVFDEDTTIFIEMAMDMKEEGNKLFQKRDYDGALIKYEKALKLLPKSHIDVAYLRSNLASCYMQMGPEEYHHAIHECNLALELSPKYTKALLKRAKCYETLNRLEAAYWDIDLVLSLEPNNLTALEISERVKKGMEKKGIMVDDKAMIPPPEVLMVKQKSRKKKTHKADKIDKGERVIMEVNRCSGNLDKCDGELNKCDSDLKMFNSDLNKCNGDLKKFNSDLNGDDVKKGEPMKDLKLVNSDDVKKGEPMKDLKLVKGDDVKKGEPMKDLKLVNSDDVKKGEPMKDLKLVNGDDVKKGEPMKALKLVFGEDIRVAQIPASCSISQLRDTVGNRFPSLKAVLIKYKDEEGDLVTITTSEELRWAEESASPQGSMRLYINEVDPEHEPLFGEESRKVLEVQGTPRNLNRFPDNGSTKLDEEKGIPTCVSNWIVQFARLFQNHVGFSSDSCLDLHELGMELYSEAMEDIVTSEEAQEVFDIAEEKFQEMAALALFNWGNVHMSRARKRLSLADDASRESVLSRVTSAYEWAQGEYVKAGKRYEDALRIKPDFYEALLALGQQKFEQAKLSWYYAIGSEVDLDSWPSTQVIDLFNNAEESMERGTEMWEEIEAQRIKNLSQPNKEKELLEKMGLDGFLKDVSADEAAEHASNMRSQINLLWGTMLYERSIVEFKLGYPIYEECLMVAVEKFKLAGASPTDLAVMIKNHCANETALEGLNFKIDELVQAWNEMYDAKRWMSGVPSFRLEPLFRRRVPKLHNTLEHM